VDGTFSGEEMFMAYTELHDIFIQVYHEAGNIVSFGRENDAPNRLHFVNGNHNKSVVPADFEDQKQRQKIAKKKHVTMPKTEEKQK
jgi:hypothetical protein